MNLNTIVTVAGNDVALGKVAKSIAVGTDAIPNSSRKDRDAVGVAEGSTGSEIYSNKIACDYITVGAYTNDLDALPVLPEMRLRSAASFIPLPSVPIRLPAEPASMRIPRPLAAAAVPERFVPMKLLSMTLLSPALSTMPEFAKFLITSPRTAEFPAKILSPSLLPAAEPISSTMGVPHSLVVWSHRS